MVILKPEQRKFSDMTYIDEENKEVHIWDSLKHIKRENHEQKEVNDSPEREKKPNVFPGNSW